MQHLAKRIILERGERFILSVDSIL